ncbi:hypothetical protein Cflav_PD2670 [Pedosphaera parvula Ellin514]|uniref:Uncharacterized protein n=1 Tax=Pedosphaera parvula (strain Ellin514) TaxID=320771 RepID=B9XKL1_PEDPL|nr:hypothetical protein Cflav_PD2670 [Pedosphaera parvula Ellin514]
MLSSNDMGFLLFGSQRNVATLLGLEDVSIMLSHANFRIREGNSPLATPVI